jgi:hypothetical protein
VQKHFFRFYNDEESVERAHSRLGEDWYNVLTNNCEHFVNWCINGLHNSEQVNGLIAAAANVYNAANESKKLSTLANVVAGRVVQKEVERQVTQAVVKSVVSKSAGILTTTSILTTTGSTGIASSLIAASGGMALAPVLAPIAVGVAVVCLIDWLWD